MRIVEIDLKLEKYYTYLIIGKPIYVVGDRATDLRMACEQHNGDREVACEVFMFRDRATYLSEEDAEGLIFLGACQLMTGTTVYVYYRLGYEAQMEKIPLYPKTLYGKEAVDLDALNYVVTKVHANDEEEGELAH